LQPNIEQGSLYTAEISAHFHSRDWPKGFKAQIVERTSADQLYLQFIVFRNNFNSFDGEDRLQIAMMVKEFMEKVRGLGVPIYMEVAKGDGRAETT
jgi:hypothetical protein